MTCKRKVKKMKKWSAVLAAFLMAILAVCGFAEEAQEPDYAQLHPGVMDYDGYWVDEEGTMLLEILVRLDGVEVLAFRTPGEEEFTSWEYLAEYDDAAKTLFSESGMKSTNRVQENGLLESQYLYDDGVARFAIEENGRLTWKDEKEDAGNGLRFIPIGCFEGDYKCGEATIRFRWTGESYAVDVSMEESGSVRKLWQYVGQYDPEKNIVEAQGLFQKLTYQEDGKPDVQAEYEEREVRAVFSMNEQFQLIWDAEGGEGDGMVFENVWTPEYLFEL